MSTQTSRRSWHLDCHGGVHGPGAGGTDDLSAQVGFLIGTALVIVLTLTCAFALRVPQKSKVTAHFSGATATQ